MVPYKIHLSSLSFALQIWFLDVWQPRLLPLACNLQPPAHGGARDWLHCAGDGLWAVRGRRQDAAAAQCGSGQGRAGQAAAAVTWEEGKVNCAWALGWRGSAPAGLDCQQAPGAQTSATSGCQSPSPSSRCCWLSSALAPDRQLVVILTKQTLLKL